MTEQRRGPWILRASRKVYDNPWIRVTEHDVTTPSGGSGIYGEVHFKSLAIGIIPIDAQGRTILVGQHRFPHDVYSWEIPEGGGVLGVDPLISAARELAEETGLSARRYAEIQRLHLSNAVSDESGVIFLAWDLTQGEAHPEETEQLQTRWVDFDEALAMVANGEIIDSMAVAGLLKVDFLRRSLNLDLKRLEDVADRLKAKHMPAMP